MAEGFFFGRRLPFFGWSSTRDIGRPSSSTYPDYVPTAEGDVELGPVDTDDTVQLHLELLHKYDEEVPNPREQSPASIFMVPSFHRDLSPHSFTPRVVSIGPLHHEDEHLKGFEVQKAAYIHKLFHNILRPLDSTPEQILKECVTKVSDSVDQIKACYFAMPTYPDSELVKMMVTDGCFILAFLHAPAIRYSSLGPIKLLYKDIFLDMVLIENQIPFFVLQDIFECTFSKHYPETRPLPQIIFKVANLCRIFDQELAMDISNVSSTHDHILGFIHKFYQNPDRSSLESTMVKAHSAVELDRSGVRFSKKLDAKWPMAMELKYSRFLCFPWSWSKPTLRMPVLKICDWSELILRNLIVYEQSSEIPNTVTSYMYAMDYLIDTPEDVAKLVRSQVLVNYIGSNEEAAALINNICKETFVDFYYQDEWKKMDEYYNAYWPKLIAELRRNYFSNPWSIIALIAGIVLFVLTVAQTVLTAFQTVYSAKAVKHS